MADYNVQDRFLKRLAFFVEKAGFRGRLARDAEIAGLHGWNAHDYSASSLADFFEAARKANFPLLDEERELEALLLRTNIIRRAADGTILPGEGAIVSISQESTAALRNRFMVHECFHGLYFIDEEFREFSRRRWEAFENQARRFLLSFFEYQAYDITDTDLVINEFMAYVLQQGVSQAGRYFGDTRPNEMIERSPWRAASLPPGEKDPATGRYYWPVIADAFAAEAGVFSRYVNDRWGLAAGRVRKISVREN
jgi:hypothetical protein